MAGKQDYRTPPEFIDAVSRRFGPPGWDLAASHGDEIDLVAGYFTPEEDSLAQCWRSLPSVCAVAWLNPPFRNIRPWVRKLDEECQDLRRWTLLLVPASMGSGWWRDHVLGKCMVFGIPRLTSLRLRLRGARDRLLGLAGERSDPWPRSPLGITSR